MNATEYNSILNSLEKARHEAVAAAEEEFDQALEALDHLFGLTNDGAISRGPGRPRKKTARKTRGRASRRTKTTRRSTKKATRRGRRGRAGGTVIAGMRDAVSKQRGQFTVADVKAAMPNKMVNGTKPAVFSTTMKRLEDLGEIKVVKRGKGRRATTYKKGN